MKVSKGWLEPASNLQEDDCCYFELTTQGIARVLFSVGSRPTFLTIAIRICRLMGQEDASMMAILWFRDPAGRHCNQAT